VSGTDPDRVNRIARNFGVGCFTFVAGLFGGGVIAVLIAKIVGEATGCKPGTDGQPCNWHIYAGYGALAGALLLPTIALSRLFLGDAAARRAANNAEQSNRG
jgi:hypothetical protein